MSRRQFGTVETRGSRPGFYVRFTWDGTRYPLRYAGRTKATAASKLAMIQTLLETGASVERALGEVFGDPVGQAMTFRDATGPYAAWCKGRKKPSTIAGDTPRLHALSQCAWAAKPLSKVQPLAIAEWATKRVEGGASGPTVNRDLSLGSALYRWAIEMGHVDTNPFRRVRKYSERGRARTVYLTPAECLAVFAGCSANLRPLVEVAARTGARLGALLQMKWRCVAPDFSALTLEAATDKAGRGHVIWVRPGLRGVLEELHRRRSRPAADGSDPLFTKVDGSPVTKWTIREFRTVVDNCATIPMEKRAHVTFHTLRHSAASFMAHDKVSLQTIGQILGHSVPAVTQRYAHLHPGMEEAALNAIDEALKPAEPTHPTRPPDSVSERLTTLAVGRGGAIARLG
jgi:integrase